MDPYEADPDKIPSSDQYKAEPFYGRYHPQAIDFKPDIRYIDSCTPAALEYWGDVLARCNEGNRIYQNDDERGRDVFAVGGVIIKSSHRKESPRGSNQFRDYSFADANEKAAVALVRLNCPTIRIPDIYFAKKINGRDVLIQERLPGVGLSVAWQYLDQNQKQSFKDQARRILQLLHTIQPGDDVTGPTYLVPDMDPVEHRGIQKLEQDMLFGPAHRGALLAFAHNDLSPSNLIVHNDRIVGLVDWEMAGFFTWETIQMVHTQIRSLKKEDFRSLDLPQDRLDDILFWNDLYTLESDPRYS